MGVAFGEAPSSFGPRLIVDGSVNGIPCSWLIDLGSQVTIADADLLRSAVDRRPSSMSIEGIGGHRLPVAFTATVPIQIGQKSIAYRVLAIEGFSPRCLLGTDALCKLQADILLGKRELRLLGDVSVAIKCLFTDTGVRYTLGDSRTRSDPDFDVQHASAFIESFRDVFTDSSKPLTVATGLKPMKIDLLPGTQPKYIKSYRKTPEEEEFVDTSVEALLAAGLVEDCESPWASSTVVAYNSDHSKMKLVIDYTWLNSGTVVNKFPLPTWKDIRLVVSGAQFVSKIDLRSAYHQCPLRRQDCYKTAFVTRNRHLQWKVVPMGLRNAPAYFQHMMTELLRGIPGVIVFLDDIGVFTRTVEEHYRALQSVLERIQQVGLRISEDKCQFFRSSLTFLGVVVSREGISPDPAKLEGLAKLAPPSSTKDLKSFLGLCNWFSEHVVNLAHLTAPLSSLLSADVPWTWCSEHQRQFQLIKDTIVSRSLTLGFPDFGHQFILQTDGSASGIGAMLYQVINGRTRVISCISRKLKAAERNYSASELEVLAVVWSLDRFREYLFRRPFVLRTDHQALTHVQALAKGNGRLARWKCALRLYDYSAEHVPGIDNVVADALSRLHSSDILHPGQAATDPFSVLLVGVSATDWRQAQHADPDCQKIQKNLASFPAFELLDGLLTKRQFNRRSTWSTVVVPASLRDQVLTECHDGSTAAHQGVEKTYLRAHQSYFWRGMYRDVVDHIKSCSACQRSNAERSLPVPLGEVQADFPLHKVAMDIVELPESEAQFSYVLVMADLFTRYVTCVPLHRTTAEDTIQAFMSGWVAKFGVPQQLLTDRGSNFSARLSEELFRFLRVRKLWTTAYHPQTDGCVERFNRSLIKMLRAMAVEHQESWHHHLPLVTWAYNSSVHSVTGYSPYFLFFGRDPPTSVDSLLSGSAPSSPSVSDYVRNLRESLRDAYCDLRGSNASRSDARSALNDQQHSKVFAPGDLVLLLDDPIPQGVAGKLVPRWKGPFSVLKKLSSQVYALQGPGSTEKIVNACKLKQYFSREAPTTQQPTAQPPPAAPLDNIPSTSAPATRASSRPKKPKRLADFTYYSPEQSNMRANLN